MAEAIFIRQMFPFHPQEIPQQMLRLLDQDSRSLDGTTGYMGRIQTPPDDFNRLANPYLHTYGIQTKRKNGQFLELVAEPEGNWNINADIIWDGVTRQTVTFNMGVTGSNLDSFVLDTSVLAGSLVTNKRRRILGGGRRFSVALYNNGAAQDFSLAAAYLHATLGDDRAAAGS